MPMPKAVVPPRPVWATLALLAFIGGPPHRPALGQAPPGSNPSARPDRAHDTRAADPSFRHPLDPLTPDEIRAAVATIRPAKALPESIRFVSVTLREPAKALVLAWQPGQDLGRRADLVLLDKATGAGFEATVNLPAATVERYEALPAGVHPSIMLDEFAECEAVAKANPEFRAALKKRGIDDVSLVMVDAWSAGHYGNEPAADMGKRLVRTLCWNRTGPHDNGYARPIEGVVAVIDLNKKEVVRVEDYGVVPVPTRAGNWTRDAVARPRDDLKPLDVAQPDGPSFAIRGQQVDWQKWTFRVGFTPREGLVLHQVAYAGRPILYRGSIAEMVVPYADPKESSYHKNVFDLGEYGIGMLANSLTLGCDCLGTIRYFDGHLADNLGRTVTIRNAICLHEEDFGLLWKHTDWRTGDTEARRSRRLAVSMIANVGNYDYGFYWYFYQDGSIQHEVKLTGIVNTQALRPGEAPRHGTEVAPRLSAPFHQHFFNARLDLDVDGPANTAAEVNTEASPPGPANPHDNAFTTVSTPLTTESAAQRTTNPLSARFWRITNPASPNELGGPVAYRLSPGENVLPHSGPDAALRKRATFLTKNLWVTPYNPAERFPAGDYPNQNPADTGLGQWTKANRPVADADIVVWYTFGSTHIPRIEDWPVMPVATIGFWLKPDGFFSANPALDVPPPSP